MKTKTKAKPVPTRALSVLGRSLERRMLAAVIDGKKCHVTKAEYDRLSSMEPVERSLWLGTFIPFRFFGKQVKLLVEE